METRLISAAAILLTAACGDAEPAQPQDDVQRTSTPEEVTAPAPALPSEAGPAVEVNPGVTFADLAGQWRVTGVAVMDGPVQAVAPDDPAYMDLMIEAGPDALIWLGKAPNGLEEDCRTPVTAPQAGRAADIYRERYAATLATLGMNAATLTPHAIECVEGSWGPQGAGGSILFPGGPDNIVMSWYDGAVLRFTRAN
ncbi:MAG: hypothetical protein WA979_12740 [Pacificimonas sp.]